MAIADYEELAARSFDDPLDPELRAAILVCADDLGQHGDPRGPLITMEHALRDADDKRAAELRKAMHEHAITEGSQLLGSAASLMQAHRTLALDWRSGLLYGMSIDARYLPAKSKITAGELVQQAIKAPIASNLRRLRVRVRTQADVDTVTAALAKLDYPPPLEQLEIYTTVWPQRLGNTTTTLVRDKYPWLYWVVLGPTLLSLTPTAQQPDTLAHLSQLTSCEPPTEIAARTYLGRALSSYQPALRIAAYERVAQLGAAANVYEHALCTLLQPSLADSLANGNIVTAHVAIVEAIAAIRPSRAARHVLAKVASRSDDYDKAVRSAAGKAIEIYLR